MSLLLSIGNASKSNGSKIISLNNKNFKNSVSLKRNSSTRSLLSNTIVRAWLSHGPYQRIVHPNQKINKVIRCNNSNTTSSSSSIMNLSESTLHSIPIEDIRNFSFIAHVDHGKSSLASRVLEHTGNITPTSNTTNNNTKEQINELDTLEVEQARGITVKATAASMIYKHASAKGPTGNILLNMVDTPGHTDFGSEVRRSLAFVQGAVILFDAVRGIQAQSWNVYEHASKNNIKLIPAVTKIDLPNARSLDVTLSISDLFHFDPDYVLNTSARNRIGIEDVLDRVCEDIPSPLECYDSYKVMGEDVLPRAQIIDSWYEQQRGVICLIQVVSGSIKEGDRISVVNTNSNSNSNNQSYSIQELGLVLPKKHRMKKLTPGLMGYAIFGIHNPTLAKPGSTLLLTKDWNYYIHHNNEDNENQIILPNSTTLNKMNHSVIYASVHPSYPEEFDDLSNAVERLALNDSGLDLEDQGVASSGVEVDVQVQGKKGKGSGSGSGSGSGGTSGQYLGPGE